MTSEVAVMNQRAIALAADSAVTLVDGGKIIVRNDRQKLFQLADGLPVAAMFFGAADLMGHPWNVLLEHYRAHGRPGPMPQVGDYADGLFGLLDILESFFPRARQKDEFKRHLASVFGFLFRYAHYLQESGFAGPDEAVLGEAAERIWQRYQTLPDGTPRRDLPCFPPGFAALLERDFGTFIDDMIAFAFAQFALDGLVRARLHDIALWSVVKDLFLEDVTGLVFAGYGDRQPYPAVATYHASTVVGGIVKRAKVDETRIDGDMHAAVALYADSEAAYAFLRGADLAVEARLDGILHGFGAALVDKVVDGFTGVDPVERESVRRQALGEEVPQLVSQCQSALNAFQQETFIDPVLAVLEVSSRQDLAETAEKLVALAIFKKRITAQNPTVGGAVDVAAISRDAGFTWIKQQGR